MHDRGLRCLKRTSDGFLIIYGDTEAAERAAVHAVDAAFELLDLIRMRNQTVSEELILKLRVAVHLGEIDVVENDREGPNVSYTFRLEAISKASLPPALTDSAEQLPLRNYVLCSEEVAGIVTRRSDLWNPSKIGFFSFKAFSA